MTKVAELKEKWRKVARQPWGRYIILIAIATVVLAFFLAPGRTTLVTLGCLVGLIVAYIACRAKRGSYKSRQTKPAVMKGPSRRVQAVIKHFSEGETLVWESRQHVVAVLPWWTLAIICSGICILIALHFGGWLTLLPWFAVYGCGYKIAQWHRYRFCITSDRVFEIRGVIKVKYGEVRIKTITDKDFSIGVLTRIMCGLRFIEDEFGNGRIESPGQTQSVEDVYRLPHINYINELLDRYISVPEKPSEELETLRSIERNTRPGNMLIE